LHMMKFEETKRSNTESHKANSGKSKSKKALEGEKSKQDGRREGMYAEFLLGVRQDFRGARRFADLINVFFFDRGRKTELFLTRTRVGPKRVQSWSVYDAGEMKLNRKIFYRRNDEREDKKAPLQIEVIFLSFWSDA